MARDGGGGLGRAVVRLAHRQRGYVTREQMLELGLGPAAIKYRVRTGALIREYAGVYAVGHRPTGFIDRAAGAVLACGSGAALSHESAMCLWGLFRYWRMPFEVTAPTERRRRGIRTHRSAALTARDVQTHFGIRVTSPARTLLDIAPRVEYKTLTRAVNNARHAGQLRLADLADVLHRYPRHPGAARLRRFVERPNGPTRSDFEDVFPPFCERFGLPTPQMNAIIDGREHDAWFPEARLIVELDSWEFHSDHDSFIDDRERDARNLAADRETYRITWERLVFKPEVEADRLHTIIARRRRPAA